MGLKGPLDVGNPHQNNQCIPDCAIHLISAPMFDENFGPPDWRIGVAGPVDPPHPTSLLYPVPASSPLDPHPPSSLPTPAPARPRLRFFEKLPDPQR